MIKFLVTGQQLQIVTPVIVADSHNYITVKATFETDDWADTYKWAHFTLDGQTYHVPLYNNQIYASQQVDLTAGTWQVYLTGNELVDGTTVTRITTNSEILFVEGTQAESPFPPITPSFEEVLAAQVADTKEKMDELSEAAEAGDFNGATFIPSVNENGIISWTNDKGLDNPMQRDIHGPKGDPGTGITVKGFYATYEEMAAAVDDPSANDCYAIGTTNPYTCYLWDDVGDEWVNIGPIIGIPAGFGSVFAYVVPGEGTPGCSVTTDGPDTAKIFTFTFTNIQGHTPVKGTDYFTADDIAQMILDVIQAIDINDINGIADPALKVGGQFLQYTGGSWVAANVPYPVTSVNGLTGDIVTRLVFSNIEVAPSDFSQQSTPTYADYPYVATIALTGVLATMFPEVIFSVSQATSGNFAPVAHSGDGTVTIFAKERPASAITIPAILCWR